jgi:CBS-domain-containing membrane protein
MKGVLSQKKRVPLELSAGDASDLMTANPLSLRDSATVRDAIAFLTDHAISAAPVIDASGRAVGVLSRTDLLIHEREKVEYLAPVPEFYSRSDLTTDLGESLGEGFQVEKVEHEAIRELMTPVVFSVSPKTPAHKVVEQIVDLKVHRLFVVDDDGILVGVISALDILRRLEPARADQARDSKDFRPGR